MRRSSLPTPIVAAFVLLVPLGLALVLPAPSSDTRELLSWGLNPSLSTPKQPPLMQWMGFLVMRFAWPTNLWCVALTQALNAIGLAYAYATLRLWSTKEAAGLLTLLLAGAVYFTAAPVAFALNADILQFPFWAAMLFHGVRAFETRAARHWIGLTLAFALAFLAKYTAVLLAVSMAFASLAVPAYRSVWRDARLYLSAAAGALLIAPHLLAAPQSGAIAHAMGTLFLEGGVGWRLKNLGELIVGFLAYLAPAWIWLTAAVARGQAQFSPARGAAASFVRATGAAALALLLLLVLGVGFEYPSRYDAPFQFLAYLVAVSCVVFDTVKWRATRRWTTAATAGFSAILLAGGAIVYGVFTSHSREQEPLIEAAARLQAEWRSRWSCGPAYVMGDFWSAYGLAISLQPPRPGVHLTEREGAPGYEAKALERDGAMLVYRDRIDEGEAHSVFPGLDLSAPEHLVLPFARTLSRKAMMSYAYVFIPPKGC